MNKILFNFLVVGFALANIQAVSAVKPSNDPEERDVYRTPRPSKKTESRIPNAPLKSKNMKAFIAPQAEGVLILEPIVSKIRF